MKNPRLTLLHSKAAAECSSRCRKQWLHLLLLKMFGVNLRQSAVREFVVAPAAPVVVGVGGADFEGAAGTVVVIVVVDISLVRCCVGSTNKKSGETCRGERECGNGGTFRVFAEIAWLLFLTRFVLFFVYFLQGREVTLTKTLACFCFGSKSQPFLTISALQNLSALINFLFSGIWLHAQWESEKERWGNYSISLCTLILSFGTHAHNYAQKHTRTPA